jgi:carboxyl-terminal processing protease
MLFLVAEVVAVMRSMMVIVSGAAFFGTVLPSQAQLASDHLTLDVGKSFSASRPHSPARAKLSSKALERQRITSEIKEASDLISRQHFAPRSITHAYASATRSMLRTLDPHSRFYSAGEWQQFNEDHESKYVGIGITLREISIPGLRGVYIAAATEGSPAWDAGLRFGDQIISVDGRDVRSGDVASVKQAIRGPDGSLVSLVVEHRNGRRGSYRIARKMIKHSSVPRAEIISPTIGYVALESFGEATSEDVREAVTRLRRDGARALVLDLRGNHGGIVEEAVRVAETFLPSGALILTQSGRDWEDNRQWFSANRTPEDMPLVVLVDEETASAAEIVAGALQDHDRALIVGRKTFGKGLIQSVLPLPGSSGMTLTSGRYVMPTGRSIQRDYSSVDLYTYLQHRTHASAIDRPYFEARTVTGRRVTGEDGIHPDVEANVRPPQYDRTLDDAAFLFVRGLDEDKREGLTQAFRHFLASRALINDRVSDLELQAALVANLQMNDGQGSSSSYLKKFDVGLAEAITAMPAAAELHRTATLARKRKAAP